MDISWAGRLSAVGATLLEIEAIQAGYDDSLTVVQAALDKLVAGVDRAGLSLMLANWRGGSGPFGSGFPGGGLPFGSEVPILTGNPADDSEAISAGTGQKLPFARTVFQNAGSDLAVRARVNLKGGLQATDNSGNGATDLDVSATVPALTTTKRVTLQISGNGSSVSATDVSDVAQRILLQLPVAPFRYRFRVRNASALRGDAYSGALDFTGFWISHAFNMSPGEWQGGVPAPMTQVAAPFSTPADGSEIITPWIASTGAAAIPKDVTIPLSWGFTCAPGTTLALSSYGVGSWHGTGAAASAGNTLPTGAGINYTAAYLDVRLEYEYLTLSTGGVPVVLAIGDSITAGNTDGGQGAYPHQTWVGAAGLRNRFAWINLGIGASYASSWAVSDPASDWRWQRADLTTTVPDIAVIDLGSNDVNEGIDDAATIEGYLRAVIATCRAIGIPKIYLATIIPRALDPTPEAVRVAVNTWIRLAPNGAAGVCDMDNAIKLQATPNVGDPDFTAENIHPNKAGYQQMSLRSAFASLQV